MEWLGMGIVPASYDNGYDIRKDRQDFFADKYTRQAIAYCLDRRTIVTNVLYGLTDVPASYLPSDHPAYDSNLSAIPYDPEVGISLLEQAGWLDEDEDPSTPRRAINVGDVAYNTPLILNYQTTSTAQRRQVVAILERSLAECGIGLNVEFLSASDLYAPGPVGFLFGRNFDLAQYALGVEGIEPPCNWFSSAGIPSDANAWIGANITGFRDEEFDAACRTAKSSLPEDTSYLASYRQTQIILAESLPAIPLYSRLRRTMWICP
jgi:peptide/nickel transport system substrate-binding protein